MLLYLSNSQKSDFNLIKKILHNYLVKSLDTENIYESMKETQLVPCLRFLSSPTWHVCTSMQVPNHESRKEKLNKTIIK